MKRFLVLPMFAAVLLSGCATTVHPTITVTPQNGGTSFVITGTGFSNVSPCATLSYVVNIPLTQNPGGSTPTPVVLPGPETCTAGSSGWGFSVTWTPPQDNARQILPS
jgi:hypothetical protein